MSDYDLQTRSFRVSKAWTDHLEEQVERLKATNKISRLKGYHVLGATIMSFAPADDVNDFEALQSFARISRVKLAIGHVEKLSKLSADERADLIAALVRASPEGCDHDPIGQG